MLDVCIVGNSGNLLKQNLGKKIDSCHDVVRIQKFKRDGFEEHVGAKLTVASLAWREPNQVREFIEFGGIDVEKHELWAAHPLVGERLHTAIVVLGQKKIWEGKVLTSGPDLYSRVIKDLYSDFWRKKPSTGIMTIELALQRFKDRKIYICGFDNTLEKDHYYDPEHIDYFPPGMKVNGHNWEKEWERIQDLIKSGRISYVKDKI